MPYIAHMFDNVQTRVIASTIASLATIARDDVTILRVECQRLILIAFDTRDIGERIIRECDRYECSVGLQRVEID